MAETPDQILADNLKAMALKQPGALLAFQQVIGNNQLVADLAKSRLSAITDDMCLRCYLTKRTREHLQAALQTQPTQAPWQ